MDPFRLRVAYQNRIRELGFKWGARLQAKAFQEHLIEELGETFLSAVDPAFAAKRMSFWIRFAPGNSTVCDMPITRHLLLAMYLFGTRDELALSLQRVSQEETAIRRTRTVEEGPTLEGGGGVDAAYSAPASNTGRAEKKPANDHPGSVAQGISCHLVALRA
ncbi:hypothetical protein C3743_39700 [Burkholderia contaminans]|uniref:Uncharacterized protein n=1 Tax=Burkholderia contaminans TaxID=488447 RepID=A0A2S5DMI2_9BURK|nr:hypothetical protein C3743_39700 [Burkholderia contaminans]